MIELGREPLTWADVEAVAARRAAVTWPDRPTDVEQPASGDIPRTILTHCVGVGPPLAEEEVRAILVVRAATLVQPDVVVHPVVIDGLLRMLADGPLPIVPSLGDPGGLYSPMLAHVARAVPFQGDDKQARLFLAGGSCTAALGALVIVRAAHVLDAWWLANHLTAAVVLRPAGTAVGTSPLSAGQALMFAKDAVNDAVENGLNGGPLASAMDNLRTAVIRVATQAERRINRLTDGNLSDLPSFLVRNSGIRSGLMLAQYTAASLVSEMRTMGQPASVDTVPTEGHRDDWVSLGPGAARAALATVELAADVAAIELLCGAQAYDLCELRHRENAKDVWKAVRADVPFRDTDRALHPDIAALGRAVRTGALFRRVKPDPEALRSARP